MCGEPLGNAFPSPAPTPPPVYNPPPQPVEPPSIAPVNPIVSPTPIPSPVPVPLPTPQYQPPAASARPTLKLIHSTGREFYLPGESGFLGRLTPSNPSTPEIDLAGIPGEGVVSRMHARIYWDTTQNAYLIMDNSSSNGTSLDGAPLRAGVAYRLVQGMLLQLGQDGLVRFTIALI